MRVIVLIAWAFWEIHDKTLKTAWIQQTPKGHDSLCCQSEKHVPKVLTTLRVAHEGMNTYDVGLGHRAKELSFKKDQKEGVWNFASHGTRAALSDLFNHNCLLRFLYQKLFPLKIGRMISFAFCLVFPAPCWWGLSSSLRSADWGSGEVTEVSLEISHSEITCCVTSPKQPFGSISSAAAGEGILCWRDSVSWFLEALCSSEKRQGHSGGQNELLYQLLSNGVLLDWQPHNLWRNPQI